jgi:hypothetical protein
LVAFGLVVFPLTVTLAFGLAFPLIVTLAFGLAVALPLTVTLAFGLAVAFPLTVTLAFGLAVAFPLTACKSLNLFFGVLLASAAGVLLASAAGVFLSSFLASAGFLAASAFWAAAFLSVAKPYNGLCLALLSASAHLSSFKLPITFPAIAGILISVHMVFDKFLLHVLNSVAKVLIEEASQQVDFNDLQTSPLLA